MSRPITIRFTGTEKLTRRMVGSAGGVYSATAKAAKRNADRVYQISQVLVPVETGALKASGRVVAGKSGAYTYRASILYGGPSSPRFVDYAVYVHEILENKHAPPTQAKFVETAYHMVSAAAGKTYQMYVSGALAREFRG